MPLSRRPHNKHLSGRPIESLGHYDEVCYCSYLLLLGDIYIGTGFWPVTTGIWLGCLVGGARQLFFCLNFK